VGFFICLSWLPHFFTTIYSAWLHSKDMSSLEKHEMEAFLADENKKGDPELCEGYRHALDPKPFVEKLKEDRAALVRKLEEREQNAKVDRLESEPTDSLSCIDAVFDHEYANLYLN
jgi:hypothetical protein